MSLLKNIAFVWVQYRHFQTALAELGRLSDRELGERGLTRGDIAWVAFEEAERRAEAALSSPGWPARPGRRRAHPDGAVLRGEGLRA